ncbi:MAG: Ig-like domain repeat protein [Anaeromyxobacteraceae bacterium]
MFPALGGVQMPTPLAITPHLVRLVSLAVILAIPAAALPQVVGDSVNMVSGTKWPGGDPYLQRQNEPSIAVSSANPTHLLAGANDYRSVDVPTVTDATKMAADAWQGVFKSYDGGQTWTSTLMPGYPQDTSWDGTHSAIRGPAGEVLYNASADPVVRAGTDGMFYFAGIVFKRGTSDGRVVVNRFIDLNNKENGSTVDGTDSIQWVDAKVIDQGAGYFADKPWIAVDVPRAGATQCTITKRDAKGNALFTRSFPGGALYAVWARIYSDVRADVMFSRSLDCGETWSAPLQLNDNKSQASQGVVASVDPRTGDVYVAWRRFGRPGAAPPQAEDAIFVARTFSKGRKFTHPRLLTTFVPFEQDQDPTRLRFRTEAFPSLASSVNPANTQSWTHVAWAQRGPGGDGQVVLSQVQVAPPPPSNDEWDDPCDGWKIPAYPIDTAAVTDDAGNAFTRGHQFMPQLTFTQGRLVAVYYDSRLDHTRAYYKPNDPCLPYGTCWGPDSKGRWYTEERSPIGERVVGSNNPADWIAWATGEIDDTGLELARHTVDVRVAIATPAAQPAFRSLPLSRMPFGSRGDEAPIDANPYDPGRDQGDAKKRPLSFGAAGHIDVLDDQGGLLRLQDLQLNPPNLPMFKNGSVPFIGDYIDVQGPVFVRTTAGWAFDIAPTPTPVFHAVWTSNQDVVPPRDGDWKNYAPPGTRAGTGSLVDSTQTVPACVVGNAGSRNQNIYTARISEGLFVSSPQNAKALSAGFLRNFVVSAVNATTQDRTFTFRIRQPVNAWASFLADDTKAAVEQVTVRIPANSSAVQTVSMKLVGSGTNPATLPVDVIEVGGLGLAGSVILNPPGLTFDLTQPDGSSDSIAAGEKLTVSISAAHLSNANLSNANLSNAHLSNANLSNANLSNANLSNANLSNATIDAAHLSNANLSNANLSNSTVSSANLSNANLSNANLSNANLSNANLSNANLSNASITDLDYTVTNTGNTTQAFDVRLLTVGTTQSVQLLVSRGYTKPIANGCDLQEQPDNRMLVNAGVVTPATAGSLATQDPLATFAIAPGESIQVTLRTLGGIAEARDLGTQVAPVVTPQGNTNGAATALVVDTPSALDAARVAASFSQTLTVQGATGAVTWTLATGSSLPPGLTLGSTSGIISGSPQVGGTFTFTVDVKDEAAPQNLTQKDFVISIAKADTATSVGASTSAAFHGDPVTLTATVGPGSGPTGTVTFKDGAADLGTADVVAGKATLTIPAGALAVGLHSFTATYGGDGGWNGSTSAALDLRVTVKTALQLSTDPLVDATHPFTYGGALSILVALGPTPAGAPLPTGAVSFLAQGLPVPSLGIVSGVAASDPFRPDAGSLVVAASYAGDVNYAAASQQQLTLSIGQATPDVSYPTSSKNPSSPGESVTFTVTVTSTAGIPVGFVTFYDGTVSLGTVPLVVDAITGKPTSSVTTSALAAGSHTITVWYEGSGNFKAAGSSTSLAQVVISASTTTTLAASPNPVLDDKPVTFTATVSASGVVATGTVSFFDGTKLLGTATLTSAGTTPPSARASLTKTSMSEGTHSITATYAGNGTLAASTSAPLSLKVLEDYSCSAYDTPLRSAGTVSAPTNSGSFTFGTKVAVKWRFKKPTGVYVTRTTAVKKLEAVQDALCNGKPPSTAKRIALFDPVAGASAGSTFVYDTAANQYKLTWDTSKASKGCWDIVLTPDNGIPQVATILKLQ